MIKKFAAIFFLAMWATQAMAINKCTGPNGAISYQDSPCAGNGVEIKVPPSKASAAVATTSIESTQKLYDSIKSDRIGREKWLAMNEARKTLELARRQCDLEQRKIAASKDTSKNNLAGATRDVSISQEMVAAAQMCEIRIRPLEKAVVEAEKACQEIKCIPVY